MKEKIIELFKKYEGAVDRSNYPEMAICEDNYNELAEDIVKLLAAPAVVKWVCKNCNAEVAPIPLGHMCPSCACDM